MAEPTPEELMKYVGRQNHSGPSVMNDITKMTGFADDKPPAGEDLMKHLRPGLSGSNPAMASAGVPDTGWNQFRAFNDNFWNTLLFNAPNAVQGGYQTAMGKLGVPGYEDTYAGNRQREEAESRALAQTFPKTALAGTAGGIIAPMFIPGVGAAAGPSAVGRLAHAAGRATMGGVMNGASELARSGDTDKAMTAAGLGAAGQVIPYVAASRLMPGLIAGGGGLLGGLDPSVAGAIGVGASLFGGNRGRAGEALKEGLHRSFMWGTQPALNGVGNYNRGN